MIRENVSGQMAVMHVTYSASSRGKPLIQELQVIKCFWCPDKEISQDLKCPRCEVYFDAVMQELTTAKTIDGRTYQEYNYEVSLCRHHGERPANAIKLEIPKASNSKKAQPKGSASIADYPPFPRVEKSPIVPTSSQTSTGTPQSTALVKQSKQPLVVAKVSDENRGVMKRVFGRTPRTSKDKLSQRTIRRHTKEQRDAAYKREQHVARRLKAAGNSNRKIAELLSDKFGKKISRTKVKGYFKDD